MDDSLVLYTFIALLFFFLSLEIYKYKFYLNGKIISFCDNGIGIDQLIVSSMLVQLTDGQIVKAEAEPCTLCMGQFSIGDEVRLIKSKDKYQVHLPLLSSQKKTCK